MKDIDEERKLEASTILLFEAEAWRLATAAFIVADLDGSIPTRKEVVEIFEVDVIYQLAEGSIRMGNLKGEYDQRIDDYWVNPDDFLGWCIKKNIGKQSQTIEFYKETILPDQITSFSSTERDLQPKQEDRERTLAMVAFKRHHEPNLSINDLLEDKDVLEFGRAKSYSPSTVKAWIIKEFPVLKKSPGRPKKS